jgi:NADH-quinone oxidoreductase subunit L
VRHELFLPALICLAPLAACALIGLRILLGHNLSERTTASIAAIGSVLAWLGSGLLTVSYVWLATPGQAWPLDYGAWFSSAEHELRVSLLVDPLALTMLSTSTSISALVGRFSVRYLHREPGFHRFFLLMSLFNSGMALLVLAGSYDLLIAGWEMVGIASMLLIAFFNTRQGPISGALRAMVSYRVADVGLLIAGVLLHDSLGSAEFSVAFHGGTWPHPGTRLAADGATVVTLSLLLAVMGKSAQFPLSGWLPRAMEGPTPSSALFYGALSVHAGVYLLLRSAPLIESTTLGSVAIGVVGALSALTATLIGRTQSDAKSAIAYATITQVGLMLVGIALHLWLWVVLHMVAHACLRLFQLLRAPSALHDALALQAALRGRPEPRVFFAKRFVPEAKLSKLYFLARQRFFLDAWVNRLLVAPVLQLGRACDVFEKAVFLDGRSEHDTIRGPIGFLYSARVLSLLLVAVTLGLGARSLRGETVTLWAGWMAIDPVSGLYSVLAALISCLILFAAPTRELTARTLASCALALAGSLVGFAAQNLSLFALAWLVSLFGLGCALPPATQLRRTFALYAACGTLPLLAAVVILAPAHTTAFGASSALGTGAQHGVFWLLATAALFRSAVFPLHSWLPALCQRAPVMASSLLFSAQLGPVLVWRALGSLAPDVARRDMPVLATWALASAIFTALLGLVQRDIKRSLGFVLSSQVSLLLFGLCDSAAETRHGALVGTVAVGLTGSGLLLIAALLADREHSSDAQRLEGRGLAYPRMSALFFLLATAAIGMPGSLHFVSEDLLLHGLLQQSPLLSIALLLVGVLNGVGLLRLFFVVFQGPTRARSAPRASDLQLGHAAIIAGLLLATVLSGLAPDWLLRLQSPDHSQPELSASPRIALTP